MGLIPARIEIHVGEVIVRDSAESVDRDRLANELTSAIAEAASSAGVDIDPAMLGNALAERVGKELKP